MTEPEEQMNLSLAGEKAGQTPPSRRRVWDMFNRIAHRYDFLNRFLSMGQDVVEQFEVGLHGETRDEVSSGEKCISSC